MEQNIEFFVPPILEVYMVQIKTGQVPYLDRWVDREHFCAFVYNDTEQRLAKSYDEFTNLISSGLWFDRKDHADKVILKVANSTPLEEPKPVDKRQATKNQFRAASSLGK